MLSKDMQFSLSLYEMLAAAPNMVRAASTGINGMLPAVFGRPFCIADLGLSIELDTPPRRDTSLLTSPLDMRQKELRLTAPSACELSRMSTLEKGRAADPYLFPVVLGNSTATFATSAPLTRPTASQLRKTRSISPPQSS